MVGMVMAKGKGKGGARSTPYSNDVSKNDKPMWQCRHCANNNFLDREICNTNTCKHPRFSADSALAGVPEGSWLCVSCNNVNYPSKRQCNTKSCGLPHPGMMMPGMMMPGMMGWPAALTAAGPPALTEAPPGTTGLQDGETCWQCDLCNNVNFAARTICNTKTCRAPRPVLGQKSQKISKKTVATAEMIGLDEGEGCWTCGLCANVNRATRTVCNTKSCKAPRDGGMGMGGMGAMGGKGGMGGMGAMEGMGGMGGMGMLQSMMGAMGGTWNVPVQSGGGQAGDWSCVQCGNVNFAKRDVCNTNTCRAQRPGSFNRNSSPQSMISAMMNAGKGGQSQGDWACVGCGNVNFAKRDTCNTRTCKMPRP